MVNEKKDHIKAAAAWSLGQIGRHSPDHAKMLAQANIFPLLIDVFRWGGVAGASIERAECACGCEGCERGCGAGSFSVHCYRLSRIPWWFFLNAWCGLGLTMPLVCPS